MQLKSFEELKKLWWDEKKDLEYFTIGKAERKKFNPSQDLFFNDRDSFSILLSGGYRAGKTDILLRRCVFFSLIFPGNEGVLGRKTATELEVVTLPQLEEICPQVLEGFKMYEYHVKQGIIEFFNKSRIYLRGLDIYRSAENYDRGKAISFIRGLNLGWYAIDQAEDIEHQIVEHLDARLSRNVPFQQAMLTSNPTNFWAYEDYKKNPKKGYRLIEVSMLENAHNLTEQHVKREKEKEFSMPRYYKQYVLGKWDEYMMGENTVFEVSTLNKLTSQVSKVLREYKGIKIYREPNDRHFYQIGVDGTQSLHDNGAFSVVDLYTGEVVAAYAKRVLNEVLASRVQEAAVLFKNVRQVIPESNDYSLIAELSKFPLRLYLQKDLGKEDDKEKQRYGYRMTRDRKRYLCDNFENLVVQGKAIMYDKDSVEEMHTFISDGVKQGAASGKYDDRVIATLLAFLEVNPEVSLYQEKPSMKELLRGSKQVLLEKIFSRAGLSKPVKKQCIYA